MNTRPIKPVQRRFLLYATPGVYLLVGPVKPQTSFSEEGVTAPQAQVEKLGPEGQPHSRTHYPWCESLAS